jgi:hypothetical protein
MWKAIYMVVKGRYSLGAEGKHGGIIMLAYKLMVTWKEIIFLHEF